MSTFKIEGKNCVGATSTWEVEADDLRSLALVLKARGIEAEKINGKKVQMAKPNNPKGG